MTQAPPEQLKSIRPCAGQLSKSNSTVQARMTGIARCRARLLAGIFHVRGSLKLGCGPPKIAATTRRDPSETRKLSETRPKRT